MRENEGIKKPGIEIGIYTLGDIGSDPVTGKTISAGPPDTGLFVGSPQQIVEKILRQYELFGHQRFMAQMDIGGLPFKKVAESIELFATKVAPIVRKETAK